MKSARLSLDVQLEREIQNSQDAFYAGNSGAAVLNAISEGFPNARRGYLLQWLPDQGEDVFWVLIDPSMVAVIEIPRANNGVGGAPLCKTIGLQEYLSRPLTSENRRKAKLAAKMMAKAGGK
jgi:hypothetical protein